ncbi:MAG: response regulator [Actinomycetota bacterium]|nr:response regulator [Actinomycetota bacterium]
MTSRHDTSQGRPIRLMLVDDNPDDRLFAERAFSTNDGLELVAVAEDGPEALAALRERVSAVGGDAPDLVLLDINMPAMDGFEVLAEVRGDPELNHIPVAMLTSSDSPIDLRRSYSVGACSYITKPLGFVAYRALADSLCHYWTEVSSCRT